MRRQLSAQCVSCSALMSAIPLRILARHTASGPSKYKVGYTVEDPSPRGHDSAAPHGFCVCFS